MKKRYNKNIYCKCGCGELTKWSYKYKRWNRYLPGHGKIANSTITEKKESPKNTHKKMLLTKQMSHDLYINVKEELKNDARLEKIFTPFEYDKMIEQCDDTFKYTFKWAMEQSIDLDLLEKYLLWNGITCDCEVITTYYENSKIGEVYEYKEKTI